MGKIKITLWASILLLSLQVNAGIIDHGYYTTDTQTQLNWLDVTATSGQSYNTVFNRISSGGDLEGWRFASSSELTVLLDNWGWLTGPPTGFSNSAGYWFGNTKASLTPTIIGTLGVTTVGGFGAFTSGLVFEENLPNSHYFAHITDFVDSNPNPDYYHPHYAWLDDHFSQRNIGSFLVRRSFAVPETSAISLLGAGLIGLIGFRKRRKAA